MIAALLMASMLEEGGGSGGAESFRVVKLEHDLIGCRVLLESGAFLVTGARRRVPVKRGRGECKCLIPSLVKGGELCGVCELPVPADEAGPGVQLRLLDPEKQTEVWTENRPEVLGIEPPRLMGVC